MVGWPYSSGRPHTHAPMGSAAWTNPINQTKVDCTPKNSQKQKGVKKSWLGTGHRAQRVKCLPCKHEDRSLTLSNPCQSPGHVGHPSAGRGRNRQISGAQWANQLLVPKQTLRKTLVVNFCPGVHTCVHIHKHTHTASLHTHKGHDQNV